MPEQLEVCINARTVSVPSGCTAASALLLAGAWRRSVEGEPRAPLCGMGICFECHARVNGVEHVRTCQVICEPGMTIETEPWTCTQTS